MQKIRRAYKVAHPYFQAILQWGWEWTHMDWFGHLSLASCWVKEDWPTKLVHLLRK